MSKIVCLILLLIQTISAVPLEKIIGGVEAEPNELPYQVSLQLNGRHFCGGVIYDKDYILTAAHCIVEAPGSIRVVAGEHNLYIPEGREQLRSSVDAEVHPEYNKLGFYENDIAILKVTPSLELNAYVTAIQLPTPYYDYSENMALVSGWGYTSQNGDSSPTLRKVSVPTMTDTTCRQYYPIPISLFSSMMCAGYAVGGKDACAGDSGGPLVVGAENNRVLVGLVSWGRGCGQANNPGVYTEVSHFIEFIKQNTLPVA